MNQQSMNHEQKNSASRTHRHLILLASGLIIVLMACVALVWWAGSHLTNPTPRSFANVPESAEPVSFASQSGSELSGWIYPADEMTAIAVLMHGVRSSRAQMMQRARHLQDRGISSLVFDFQAHGESPGDRITLGYLESLDAQAAVEFMTGRYPGLPVLLVGVSMGGAAAVLARPSLEVNVMVLESVYPDIMTAVSNRLETRFPGGRFLAPLLTRQIAPRIGIEASRLSPEREAGRVTAAVLVVSGKLDPHTTMDDTKRLHDRLPEPKQLAFIEGAAHVDLERFNPDTYWGIVWPFIRQHLTNPDTPR